MNEIVISPEQTKLFAVYLGGSAPRANTELHDVVFAVGADIESTYEQLLEAWFGSPDGLHIDSWIELEIIDGYRVTLSTTPSTGSKKLFFVNMGAYAHGELIEVHANTFFVSDDKKDVVKRAKNEVLKKNYFVHRDYLYDVDECLEIVTVGSFYVHLEKSTEQKPFLPVSAYHLLPRELVKEFKMRKLDRLDAES